MKTNVGGIDRILRIVIGLVLIALTLTGTIGVCGLDWRGAAAYGSHGLLPVVHGAGLQHLPHEGE